MGKIMGSKNKQVDAYIAKAAPFAQTILDHLRQLVHQACPEVQETIKWGFPHFEYHGILCSMAAFKQHCAFTFWKAALMSDKHKLFSKVKDRAMGHLGKLKVDSDLPRDDVLRQYIREAMQLNKEGKKLPARATAGMNKALKVPAYFSQVLNRNRPARETFENFSYSNKNEYIEWITDAKTEDTRNKRIAQAITWLADRKVRNWQYLKK
jgi:uncharacterized protein YdeI (YjbR/CyaY-like superfamily)